MAVIPAKAGIQWLVRGTRLNPGSALWAVRDDVEEEGRVIRDDVEERVLCAAWDDVEERFPLAPPMARTLITALSAGMGRMRCTDAALVAPVDGTDDQACANGDAAMQTVSTTATG